MGNHRTSFGKHEGKTEYEYVYRLTAKDGKTIYKFKINRYDRKKTTTTTSKPFDTAREAAIAVDMWLLNKGLEAVNILKKK